MGREECWRDEFNVDARGEDRAPVEGPSPEATGGEKVREERASADGCELDVRGGATPLEVSLPEAAEEEGPGGSHAHPEEYTWSTPPTSHTSLLSSYDKTQRLGDIRVQERQNNYTTTNPKRSTWLLATAGRLPPHGG